jgi:hypothetical protein
LLGNVFSDRLDCRPAVMDHSYFLTKKNLGAVIFGFTEGRNGNKRGVVKFTS